MAEDVIIRYGRFEVNPQRLEKYIRGRGINQQIDDSEVERIVNNRKLYLEWMHYHFAKSVLKPPE